MPYSPSDLAGPLAWVPLGRLRSPIPPPRNPWAPHPPTHCPGSDTLRSYPGHCIYNVTVTHLWCNRESFVIHPPLQWGPLARLRSRLGSDGDWGPRHDLGPQQHATVAWECAVVGGWLGRVRFVHAALVHAPGRPPPRCAKTGTWQLVGMHTVLATGDLTTRLPHYTPHHSPLARRGGA